MGIPSQITAILSKLEKDDEETLRAYIAELMGTSVENEEDDEAPTTTDTTKEGMPPLYESGEDYDAAADAKQKAADLKSAGEWAQALELYTQAVLAAPPSALLYANRAACLIQLERYDAAVRDCDQALQSNPDSAKALRMRGKARKALGQYELALQDLSASQAIDFDEGTVEDLKFLTEKRVEAEMAEATKRNEEEEKMRKRAQEIKKAQEDAKREAAEAAAAGMGGGGGMPFPGGMPGGMGGMPPGGMGGGMPGGMGGMPGMAEMMQDPEVMAAMQNPKVISALTQAMSNPAKMAELMSDPEVGPVLQKIMGKFGGAAGGGMPPNFGGMGGEGKDNDDEDDIPDIDDLPELEEID